jgi:hypothetical protein
MLYCIPVSDSMGYAIVSQGSRRSSPPLARFLSTVIFGLKAMESESTILNLYIGERIQLLGDNGIDVLAFLPNSIHCANHSLFHWY